MPEPDFIFKVDQVYKLIFFHRPFLRGHVRPLYFCGMISLI